MPATIEFTDSIGAARAAATALVEVAGYKNADALVHVVRAFRDEAVPHPALTIDPLRDAQAMEDELILADLGVVERRMERLEKDLKKSKTAELEKERDVLARASAALADGQPLRALGLTGDDLRRLRGFQFLSAKPLLVVINLDEADIASAGDVAAAAQATGLTPFLARAGTRAVPVCAKIELEIAQLDPADAAAFLSDLGLAESGLDRVIRASYDLLGYMSFFTVGEDECRAWSIPRAHAGAARRRRDPQRHPAGLHPRRSGRLRCAGDTRVDGGVQGRRRGAARGQGVRRAGRRHHQLPSRHVATRLVHGSPHRARLRNPGASRAGRRRAAGQAAGGRAAGPRLRDRPRVDPVQVVSEAGDPAARRRLGAARPLARATAARSIW